MKKKLHKLLDGLFLPKWIVLNFDLSIICFVFFFTYFYRINLGNLDITFDDILLQSVIGLPVFIIAYYFLKPHNDIIRNSSLFDIYKIMLTLLIGTSGLFLTSVLARNVDGFSVLFIPFSVIILHFFISLFILASSRLFFRFIFFRLLGWPTNQNNVLIFGAGAMGIRTRLEIEQRNHKKYNIVGFIDDNFHLQGDHIGGLQVFSEEDAFEKQIGRLNVKEIIFAINKRNIASNRKSEIIDRCLRKKLKVSEVPETAQWLDGKLSASQIMSIGIEGLLSSDVVSDFDKHRNEFKGKTILVTGAAGSIGSELVRQIISFEWKRLILVDIAESSLYNLQNEIIPLTDGIGVAYIVADVTDSFRMQQIFEANHPDVIFHASAYKHVPLMEDSPYEAIKCNVGGLKIMADLAVKYTVEKFVLISTDKAVNPTNVMGASKRICEIYVQALSQKPGLKTKFITTRFGNVLESNGSVIQIFKQQIRQGGPVQVTHKEIKRFFMTIFEACQLVLEASFMGKGGEIFLFDMGQPVKIYDLAINMIQLSGLIPHKDIAIVEIGLRPGEKLYEELLSCAEDSLPTEHKKILIGKVRHYNVDEQHHKITELLSHKTTESDEMLVTRMKNIVPEFTSKNSRFEKLDYKAIAKLSIMNFNRS